MITEQAAEWHVTLSQGELSPEQAREFMRWMRASPINVAEYLAITGLAKGMSEAARESTASVQDLLARKGDNLRWLQLDFGDRAPSGEVLSPRAYHARVRPAAASFRRIERPIVQWAAVFGALIIVGVALTAGWRWLGAKPPSETIATRNGEVRSLRLPDDTFVKLDSDSAITIYFDGDYRRVTVDRGQAYFEVAKDPERPFSVRVEHSLIRDIGTAFDVYRQATHTTITVAEGRVQIRTLPRFRTGTERLLAWIEHEGGPNGALVASLGAGKQVQITSTGQVTLLGAADVQRTLAWTHGRIVFDNQTIASVADEFNRYNNVRITVVDPTIGKLPISGVFDAHDVSAFMTFLDSMPNIKLEKRGQHIDVSARSREHRHPN